MKISEFDFDLPVELIAQTPTARRSASRLLTVAADGAMADRQFDELPALLNAGDLIVINNTKVFPARLFGNKASGGSVEVLVERLLGGRRLLAQLRANRTPKVGSRIRLPGPDERIHAQVVGRDGDLFELRLSIDEPLLDYLETVGQIPLPPYIQRAPDRADRERYQTVYAQTPGAVAAPTAGLHFDRPLLDAVGRNGVGIEALTLHVGAGTFQPLRTEVVEDHKMHAEFIDVSAATCARIAETRRAGGRVIAVGTTVARALESVSQNPSGLPRPYSGATEIYIYPGYSFRCVDLLITNFHLPRSSLLLLVSAFAGRKVILTAYRHAVKSRYRFFSYGDAMLLTRE